MVYSQEKQTKLTKYCYRMNKACAQRDIRKTSDYFNHLKHHAMKGGALSAEIEELLRKLNTSIDSAVDKVGRVESENTKLSGENLGMRNTIDELNARLKAADSNLATAENKLATTEANLDAAQKKLATAEANLVTAEADLDALKASGSSSSTNISALNTKIVSLEAEVTRLQADVTRLQADVTRLESVVTSLQADVDQLTRDKTTLETELNKIKLENTFTSRLASATNEAGVNSIMGDAAARAVELGSAIDNLKAIETAVKQRITDTDGLAAGDKVKLEAMEASLNKQITDLTAELDNLRREKGVLEDTNAELTRNMGTKDSSIAELTRERDSKMEEITQLQTDLKGITSDTDFKAALEKIITQIDRLLGKTETEEEKEARLKAEAARLKAAADLSAKTLKEGDRVKIGGFQKDSSRAKYNGKSGTITNELVDSSDPSNIKYPVKIDDEGNNKFGVQKIGNNFLTKI